MANPYIYHTASGVKVYFWAGELLPEETQYLRNQTVKRSADGHLKVYDTGWNTGSAQKRIWTFKAQMNNTFNLAHSVSGYNYDDLINFLNTRSVFARYSIYFYDCLGNQYLVKIVAFKQFVNEDGYHEITLILEEDYS